MYFMALVSVLVIEGMKDEGVVPGVGGSSCEVRFADSTESEELFGGNGGGVKLPLGSPVGAVDASLSVEMMDADLPLRIFVSTKPDTDELSELELRQVWTTCAFASRSWSSFPASSWTPLTWPSAACMESSTAGLARAAAGAAGLFVPEDEPGRGDEDPDASAPGFCRRTSLIESNAVGSLGCSFLEITAEYVSGSCHPISSSSGSGSEVVLPRKRFKEEPGVKNEERVSCGVEGGAAGRAARRLLVDMLANSRW